MADWLSLFAVYRVVVIRDEEVVHGILHPEVGEGDPRLMEALVGWGGTHFLHQGPEGAELTLVRPIRPRRPERWWLHLLLGALTLFTATLAGAYFAGHSPIDFMPLVRGGFGLAVPVGIRLAEVVPGLTLSVPLLGILLAHELGHYLAARRHGMDVSPPYFIPAPPWFNFVGTFGAFIRLRSAMINRVMLLDVGAAGPIASFALSVPALALGIRWSRPVGIPVTEVPAPFVVLLEGQPIWLGGSLITRAVAALTAPEPGLLALHPLAMAGWVGLFVTTMNLFPLAQLDGGHILFALIGRWQRRVALVFLAALLLLGTVWVGWWVWAGVVLVLGRGVVGHPEVFDPRLPVGGWRSWIGWACVAIFLLSFVLVPLHV